MGELLSRIPHPPKMPKADMREFASSPKRIELNRGKVTMLSHQINFPSLFSATQALEWRIMDAKHKAGVLYWGCGNGAEYIDETIDQPVNIDPRFGQNNFGHVLEHALIAVLHATISPIDEQCAGSTHRDGTIIILPSPSVDRDRANAIIEFTLGKIQEQTSQQREINLIEIAERLSETDALSIL